LATSNSLVGAVVARVLAGGIIQVSAVYLAVVARRRP